MAAISNIAKWALLVAGAVVLIGIVLSLPFVNVIDVDVFGEMITNVVTYAGGAIRNARGMINNFVFPAGAYAITAVIGYLFTKWFVISGIKVGTWIYHFIFK